MAPPSTIRPFRPPTMARRTRPAIKADDPRRQHGVSSGGTHRYTPFPGRGPYPWKVTTAPGGIPGADRPIGTHRSGGGNWIAAPSDSHLDEFRYLDARQHKLIRGFNSNASAWRSILAVRYDDGSEYEYYFKDHDRGSFIFDMMVSAESPGEVVWSHLIEDMVPYKQTVVGTRGRRKPPPPPGWTPGARPAMMDRR